MFPWKASSRKDTESQMLRLSVAKIDALHTFHDGKENFHQSFLSKGPAAAGGLTHSVLKLKKSSNLYTYRLVKRFPRSQFQVV